MVSWSRRSAGLMATVPVLLAALEAAAQTPAPSPSPGYTEYVQVTATRVPEDSESVPGSITVITSEELRDRGASDLRGALALAAGVDVAPGGDGGPASSVPEFWGLKEFDAFLLVVDGVPWGGAFNPALASLDLNDVERIEIQRGPAPVMYGATSFVGVIQVVRRPAGASSRRVVVSGGSYASGSGLLALDLPAWLGFRSSLSGDFTRVGFKDDRTGVRKGHVLWRNRREGPGGTFRFDVDGTWLDQDPGSPTPRQGMGLSPLLPVDSNQNPAGAFLNERRLFIAAAYDRPVSFGTWSTLLSVTPTKQEAFRGFLVDVSTDDPNAHGFRETIHTTDLYVDTHLAWTSSSRLKLLGGLDYLHGNGTGRGGDFDYFVNLDGANPPASAQLPPAADIRIEDRRDFFGLYGQVEWKPAPAWRIEAGLRLNVTRELRSATTLDFESGELDAGQSERNVVRPGASAGVTWTAWEGEGGLLRLFADYRNAYKPAAIDFGLDSSPEILKPETAQSGEVGLKGHLGGGAVRYEVSAFLMDFDNLVVAQSIGGLPALTNAGRQRFKGAEAAVAWRLREGLSARAAYSYHDARFRDYVTEFDGVPTQLAGNRLEMSARDMGAAALTYAPARGVTGSLEASYVGSRYLNKRNTALASGYLTWSASLGYRARRWEARVAARNLSDRRDPVAESELGDAQYYRLPPRRVDVTATLRF